MAKFFKPVFYDIWQDQTNVEYCGKYIAFFVVGTWSVIIDDMTFLPGDFSRRDLQGENGEIRLAPEIEFKEDLTYDPAVMDNKRLKQGKHLRYECLQMNFNEV